MKTCFHLRTVFAVIMAFFFAFVTLDVEADSTWAPRQEDYVDTNKTVTNPDEELLCWAAAASNLLEWGNHKWSFCNTSGLPLAGVDPELALAAQNNEWFSYFKSHWTNGGFDTDLALKWIFEGVDTTPWYRDLFGIGAQLKSPGGASFSEGTYGLIYIDEPGSSTATQIKNLLNSDPVILTLFCDSCNNKCHVITCYGIEYEYNNGLIEYTGIWYTDSDPVATPIFETLPNGGKRNYQNLLTDGEDWFLAYNDGIHATHKVRGLTTLAPAIVPSFNVTPTSDPNGSISPNEDFSATYGEDVIFYAAPANGYIVDKWYVNGTVVQTGGDTYTCTNVISSCSIYVAFKQQTTGGETITLPAIEYANIYSDFPASRNLYANFMSVYYNGIPYQDWAILLKFNLSGIPAGSTINSARLELYCQMDAGNNNIGILKCTSSWSQNNVCWDNIPTRSSESFSSNSSGIGTWIWANSLLDQHVQGWVNNPNTNYGVFLGANIYGRADFSNGSSQVPSANRPKLIVTHTPPQTKTISGYIRDSGCNGISGVTVSANSGGSSATTNSSGSYSISVSYGWSGQVTPTKAGFDFLPAYINYPSITSNQTNQNYTGALQSRTISGYVRDSGDNGISGVTVSANNGGGSIITGSYGPYAGDYSISVPYGWSGQVTLTKAGFNFLPAYINYPSITSNQTNQNYTGNYMYSGGSGIQNNPYKINTITDWQVLMASPGDWCKHFIMVNDIDFSGTQLMPIGNSSTSFSGVFDGNGHILRNAVIGSLSPLLFFEGDSFGLFGVVTNQIHNTGAENVNIICDLNAACGGGLVGENRGTLISCYVTGAVSYADSLMDMDVDLGGLVGQNSGTITSCYATGTVSGNEHYYVLGGGLVGRNSGTISNCYSICSLSSFLPSDPLSFQYTGGLVGTGMDDNVVNSFWDVNSSGLSISDGGTGKTTAEMKTLSTFASAGWDFETVWRICDGTNYPKLAWQEIIAGDFVCPDGVDFRDYAVLARQWMFEKLSYDVVPDNGDGSVNFLDWSVFAKNWNGDISLLPDFTSEWLNSGASCDIAPAPDGDGVVNILDFAVFAENWLVGQ
jgi:hypothetical protein